MTVVALSACVAAGGIVRVADPSGQSYFEFKDLKHSAKQTEAPPEYTTLLGTMSPLVRMSRNLDPNGNGVHAPLPRPFFPPFSRPAFAFHFALLFCQVFLYCSITYIQ